MLDTDVFSSVLRTAVYIGTITVAGGQLVKWMLPQLSSRTIQLQSVFGAALLLLVEAIRILSFQIAIAGGDTSLGLSTTFLAIGAQMGPQQASMLRLISALVVFIALNRSVLVMRLLAFLLIASYLLEGHTVSEENRILSGSLLFIHITIAHWWFASLYPLIVQLRDDRGDCTRLLIERFSSFANYAVPILLAAGATLLLLLLDGRIDVDQAYQKRFVVKLVLVATILAIAALNKFLLTPALRNGQRKSTSRMQAWIFIELIVASSILAATAWAILVGPEA